MDITLQKTVLNALFRCPHCGVAEGEPIEREIPVVSMMEEGNLLGWKTEVTHEAYFNSIENAEGETEHICSECRGHFTYEQTQQGGEL